MSKEGGCAISEAASGVAKKVVEHVRVNVSGDERREWWDLSAVNGKLKGLEKLVAPEVVMSLVVSNMREKGLEMVRLTGNPAKDVVYGAVTVSGKLGLARVEVMPGVEVSLGEMQKQVDEEIAGQGGTI